MVRRHRREIRKYNSVEKGLREILIPLKNNELTGDDGEDFRPSPSGHTVHTS